MESVVPDSSPLADLLEGEGQAHAYWDEPAESPSAPSSPIAANFAPRGPSTLQKRLRDRLPEPLKVSLTTQGPVARIQRVCSHAVNSRLGRADNERFLEQFRYLIVASHILTEHTSHTSFKPLASPPGTQAHNVAYKDNSTSLQGAVITGVVAFALVWLLQWARKENGSLFGNKTRSSVMLVVVVAAACGLHIYLRRQKLRSIRYEAVDAVSTMVTNLQAFDASSSSALTFIQEVELISRGYRITSPLPPITRMEDKGQSRQCVKLRRRVQDGLQSVMTPFLEQYSAIRSLTDEDCLEKYFDIYDISSRDVQEACYPEAKSEDDDVDSLRALRLLSFRYGILSRIFLCSLLALQADGTSHDFTRWRAAIDAMQRLAMITGEKSEAINAILKEEESFTIASPKSTQIIPEKERVRAQLRKLNSLSHGIRGLQAKMQVLREESNRTLEESNDVRDLGANLMSHYESIGVDLRSLMQAWESGKAALALSIDRQDRRISQASTDLLSPAPSLSGLTVVDGGTPADALRALNGESTFRSSTPSISESASDEEVFEAIAMPRQRPRMTPAERKSKILEDQARQQMLREQHEASTNMLKELESVINLRPRGAHHGRITSI